MTYPDYKAWLIGVWVDGTYFEREYSEAQPEWVYATLHEIEKMFDKHELETAYDRFVKRGNDHLYVGAQVRIKRDLYYGELHHDPKGQNPGALPYLEAGLVGEIVNVDLSADESDNGYYDCEIRLADASKWLMRVEWLEWLEDIENAGNEY